MRSSHVLQLLWPPLKAMNDLMIAAGPSARTAISKDFLAVVRDLSTLRVLLLQGLTSCQLIQYCMQVSREAWAFRTLGRTRPFFSPCEYDWNASRVNRIAVRLNMLLSSSRRSKGAN